MNSDPQSGDVGHDHPDVEELSAFSEGVLPPDQTRDVRSHLSGCSLCADVHESLEEVRDLLGRLPGPPPMPADIAERIEAALAAEALMSSTLSPYDMGDVDADDAPASMFHVKHADQDEGTDTSKNQSVGFRTATQSGSEPDQSTGPRTRDDHGTPSGSGSSRHPASAGPARGRQSGPGRVGKRRRWPLAVLGTTSGAAVLGFGALFLNSGSGGLGMSDSDGSGASAEKQTSQHLQTYADSTLTPMVQELLANRGSDEDPRLDATEDQGRPRNSKSPLVAPREDDFRSDAPQPLPGCVLQATGRPSESPLAIDRGEYRGKPVGVVILSDPADTTQVDVFLVDSSCASDSPSTPGTVLLERSVPRR